MREQKTAIHRGPPTLMFIKIYRSIDNTNHSNKIHTCAYAQRDVTQQYATNFSSILTYTLILTKSRPTSSYLAHQVLPVVTS